MFRANIGHVGDIAQATIGHEHLHSPICGVSRPPVYGSVRPIWRIHSPGCRRSKTMAIAMPQTNSESPAGGQAADVAAAKRQLLQRIAGTERGAAATRMQRGFITEAQVAVEAFGGDLDLEKLEGSWRLLYTTASDVLPLVGATAGALPLRVADIYQQFSSPAEGTVRNIIKLSVWPWLQEGDGARFCVDAEYEVRSGRRIGLTFRAAGISEIVISPLLETILAPALLPRTFVNQQILLFLKELAVTVPLPLARTRSASSGGMSAGTGDYLLTYLDEDMLIGRAQQGLFIFERCLDSV